MKLDLFYEIDVPRPWPGEFPENQRRAEQESYAEAFEQIQLADKLGFNTIWLVEHHFREGRSHCSAPEVVHGALSQVTENIRLGFGVTLVPQTRTVSHSVDITVDPDAKAADPATATLPATLLTQQFGVPAENLTSQGYGKQYLKEQTDGPSAINRRVTVRRITPLLNGGQASLPPPPPGTAPPR